MIGGWGGGIGVNLRYMRMERWPVTWDRSSFFGSYKMEVGGV